MKTILVSGFEPFDNSTTNPSMDAVLALPNICGTFRIEKLILPVTFSESFQLLEKTIHITKPDAVICTGVAAGRSAISLERVAINIADARIPDNAGYQPIDELISPQGPAAYFSTLPLRQLLLCLQNAGVPAEISNSAGTYVCNYVMYRLLDFLALQGTSVPTGFIHIPAGITLPTDWLKLVIQAL